jgi:hypothetical protein
MKFSFQKYFQCCAVCGVSEVLSRKAVNTFCEDCWSRFLREQRTIQLLEAESSMRSGRDSGIESEAILSESVAAAARYISHSTKPHLSQGFDLAPPMDLNALDSQWLMKARVSLGFPSFALLSWTPESQKYIKPIIYSLKGGRNKRLLQRLKQSFAPQLLDYIRPGPKLVLCPPARRGSFNHARLIAESFFQFWQAETTLLELVSNSSSRGARQKQRSVEERKAISFQGLKVDLSRFEQILFVDDVITSGATAKAAFLACGESGCFEAFAIADRVKLAGRHEV